MFTVHIEDVVRCFGICTYNENCFYFNHTVDDLIKPANCSFYSNTSTLRNSSNSISNNKIYQRILPRDCFQLYNNHRITKSGVYDIYVGHKYKVNVYCEMEIAGGGWTVFQKRFDGSVSFERNWEEYKNGFGDSKGEYWLGNEIVHNMTAFEEQELYVRGEDFDGEIQGCQYDWFYVDSDVNKYRLNYSVPTIPEGPTNRGCVFNPSIVNDAFMMMFTIYDQDNDKKPTTNCAEEYKAGWWHNDCFHANLNGPYSKTKESPQNIGIIWNHWTKHFESLKISVMMMRRKANNNK